MRAVDMEAVKARTVDYETLGWPATYFSAAYKSLIRVLQRPLSTTPTQYKTSAPYDTPPHQTTVPANPNLSKESDSSMGTDSSCQSKPEPFTERFMDEFVTGVLGSIDRELMPIPWLRQEHNFYLSMEYALFLLC
jgi:hypothetical protein